MTKTISINQFRVKIYDTRAEMGFCAADEAAAAIRGVLAQKEECNMIFAAAPSQNEMLAALAAQPGIEWNRVNAFHMDEYIGLAPDAPQGFANFLRAAIFTKVPFRSVNCLDGTAASRIRSRVCPLFPTAAPFPRGHHLHGHRGKRAHRLQRPPRGRFRRPRPGKARGAGRDMPQPAGA